MPIVTSRSKYRNTGRKLDPIAPRKTKIVYNFGLSESNRVKLSIVAAIKKDMPLKVVANTNY